MFKSKTKLDVIKNYSNMYKKKKIIPTILYNFHKYLQFFFLKIKNVSEAT